MVRLSESLAEARRIVERGVLPDDFLRLALRVTSRVSGNRAADLHDRFIMTIGEVELTAILGGDVARAKRDALAVIDEIERASTAN